MVNYTVYERDVAVATYADGQMSLISSSPFIVARIGRVRDFLMSRVMPEERWDDYARKFYGIESWDPYTICRLTHGQMPTDFLWVRFEDEGPEIDWTFVKAQIWQ